MLLKVAVSTWVAKHLLCTCHFFYAGHAGGQGAEAALPFPGVLTGDLETLVEGGA